MMDDCLYKDVCTRVMGCGADCIRYREMSYLLQESGIPERKQRPISLTPGVDYDAFCALADIKDSISDYVQDGLNLLIGSTETGNGKTSWAIKLMLKYFDQIWAGNGFRVRGLFVHVPTMLTRLKNFDDPSLDSFRENLKKADLVIWDDIAGTKLSDYDTSQLLIILDDRILNERSNIYTCNIVTPGQLEQVVGARLASRIWNCSAKIMLKGKDRRDG